MSKKIKSIILNPILRRGGYKKAVAIWLLKTGAGRIIFTKDFLNAFSLQKLTSSLSFSYNCRQCSGESQC